MGNSKSGNCPWTTVYNVHGICPLFHEEMLEKFHGQCPQCPQYPGHCPWIPWTLSTHSMGSMDIVHTFHRFHGQCPLILWKMSRMSMESMDFLQTGHSTFDSPRVNPTEKSPEESSYRRNHGRVIVSVSAKNKATEP